MARSMSSKAMEAIFAQETDQVFLVVIVIDHPDMAEPVRLVQNNEDIQRLGNTYFAFPFELVLPTEDNETVPRATLRIDNIERTMMELLRSITSAPTINLAIILAESPDTIEAGPFNFIWRSIRYDALSIEGDLEYEDILNDPYPAHKYTPQNFPGLF